eukprot:7187873-Prymnesium_polylepis.1
MEELDGDALVDADQVEREYVSKAPRVVKTSIPRACRDCRRRGEEFAHEIDGVHAHVRDFAQRAP